MSSHFDDRHRDIRRRDVRYVVFLAAFLIVTAATVAWLSISFGPSTANRDRPVIAVLVVWAVSGIAYLAAIRVGCRLPDTRSVLWGIIGVSLLMRAILLPTTPVLEIDLYRYIWDGNATEAGVSPFQYSPDEVRLANTFGTSDPELQRLVDKVQSAPSLDAVVKVVHFGQLRTPYPPVSQAVFFVSAVLTPDSASVTTHVFVMKAVLGLFDIATLVVMLSLLRRVGLPIGWAIAYGWCPLVLKEFANSGHLDTIAVFLAITTVWLVTPRSGPIVDASQPADAATIGRSRWLIAAVVLAAAVAAKIYPLVLAPLLFVHAVKLRGWRIAFACVALFSMTAVVLFAPMLGDRRIGESQADDTFALPAPELGTPMFETNDDGLQAFLEEWEINDLLFALVVENIKPRDTLGEQPEPWFSVIPQSWRTVVLDSSRVFVERGDTQAFFVSRVLVGLLYLAISLWLAARLWGNHSSSVWLESVFLAVAWLWLFAPTQNPWYWTWALVFIPFARNKAWLLLAVLALAYYGRFWCEYHAPSLSIGSTTYAGVYLFDLVLVWIEYLPFWAVLIYECVHRTGKTSNPSQELDFQR